VELELPDPTHPLFRQGEEGQCLLKIQISQETIRKQSLMVLGEDIVKPQILQRLRDLMGLKGQLRVRQAEEPLVSNIISTTGQVG
jgi:hypothetical protein